MTQHTCTLRKNLLKNLLLSTLLSVVLGQQAPENGWCYVCGDVENNAPPLCNTDCTAAAQRLCAGNLTTALEAVQGNCELQYMPPTSKSPQNSASVADSTCLAAYESIATSCGRNATGTFDPNFCTESGGGGTMGWNNDGTVISGSPRYIMKTLNSDECSQFQSYENLATSTIQWNNSWVPLDAQIILDTTSDPVPVPALPELQTQGCTDDVCYNGNPAYFAVCEGQPSRQNPHTMRHRVVFNGWTSTSGEELLSALRLRCDQDILDWQAWNNGTAWLAEFGLYSDDKGSSCDCIPPAIFDASVGINVNPAGCCEANISPGPLFATM